MNFKTTTIALAVMLACQTSHAQSAKELAAQLKQMQEQLQSLRAELDALKQQKAAATPAPAPAQASAIAVPAPATANPNVPASTASAQPAASVAPGYGTTTAEARAPQENPLSIFGYGELNYSRLKNDATSAVATAKRAVIGIAYRFNDRTRFASEFEVEDAVASASDQGEAEFEQLYVEHDLTDNVSAKMGLFLMPFGYINESHEPTRYYGVTRNLVETAIIPSTWREMGVGFRGNLESTGMRWTAGLTTSFNLSKWPTTSDQSSTTAASPLAAIHQEGQNANASSPGYYGGLNYDGIPGFNVGGTVFHGGIGQRVTTTSPQTDTAASSAPNASVTLAELHAKWQIRNWELSSVAARGTFNGVANFNAATSPANPVPDAFRGWYAQAAYHLWKRGDYSVVPFGRYERVNTAVGFSGLPQGTVIANDQPDNRVWTWGANFYLHPQVVLKADFQRYLNDSSKDRYEFGVGFQY